MIGVKGGFTMIVWVCLEWEGSDGGPIDDRRGQCCVPQSAS